MNAEEIYRALKAIEKPEKSDDQKDDLTGDIRSILFYLKAAISDYRAPQRVFDSHSEVVTARLEPTHMMMIMRSLQADAAQARSHAQKCENEVSKRHALEYAASREVYCQQMLVHLSNAVAEYQPEDANESHSISADYFEDVGINTGGLPQDEPPTHL